MADGTVPLVLGPGEGRPIDLGNFAMSLKADDADTGGAFTLLEAAEPAGFGPPMHIHHDAGEAFYVPPGVVHGFRVGGVPSRKLNIYVPAAMVGYFDELAEASRRAAPLDVDALGDLAGRYRMEVAGDAPQGYV